ncbi:MAG: fluoride efflux transporter CrcB [Alphaproteobacteria bacterium]|nr:fluoride efflux transporter CrcB [Alphaproteobacteria bacterium]MBF0250557.1 fluoride efflux transporter CrcB [Alphaproteobacteria bacterium]
MSAQMMMFVALGGAIGAVARFLAMSAVGHMAHVWGWAAFPWGTLSVNVSGAFILGAVLELSALAWSPSPEIRAMVVVGGLGAFTTFSTFSMDLYHLMERGALMGAGLYAVASVLVCLAAFAAGMHAFRMILT